MCRQAAYSEHHTASGSLYERGVLSVENREYLLEFTFMRLKLFKTLSGHTTSFDDAARQAIDAGFDGIEGPSPESKTDRQIYRKILSDHGLDLPDLQLTIDFSHWCCVCERLVLDELPDILELCAIHAKRIHAEGAFCGVTRVR